MSESTDSVVNAFYLAYYGRPADPAGLAFWSSQLERSGGDFGAIIDFFSTSAEAAGRFGDATVAARIATIYQQLFGRAPDAVGLQFWVDAIDAGHTTVAAVAMEVLRGAQGTDITVATLRQQAAADFTALVARDGGIAFDGDAAVEASRALLAAVGKDTGQDALAAMVKVAAGLVDIAHDTPAVVAALGGDLAALFATARGQAEPADLLQAPADSARAAAGNPDTLAALLRGGGMAKVLEVMPAGATLHAVVEALAAGGLPAAIEVVYPSAPDPVVKVGYAGGVLTLSGDARYDALLDLDAHTLAYNGTTKQIAGVIDQVAANAYPGTLTLSGTLAELDAVLARSAGVDAYRVLDAKAALFDGAPQARTLAAGAIALLKGAALVTVKDVLSAEELGLLRALDGFDIGHLRAATDLVAPAAGTLHFVDLDTTGVDPVTKDDTFSLAVDGAEAGARIAYQVRAAGQDGWTDLPSAALAGVAEGVYSYRAVVLDAAGNASTTEPVRLTIDKTAPAVGTLAFGPNDGALALGESIDLAVSFSEIVTVDGIPTLLLDNGGSATYASGSGTATLVFTYSPAAGQDTAGLALAPQAAFAGSILDRAGNPLAAGAFDGKQVAGTVTVDTAPPAQRITFTTISQDGGTSESVSGSDDPLSTNLATASVHAKLSAVLAAGEYIEVSFDGGLTWSAQEASVDGRAVTVTNVDAASHAAIALRVIDAAGNAGSAVSRAIVHDTVAPDTGTVSFASISEDDADGHADNVTNIAVADLVLHHAGNWPAAGERLQYSTDGSSWSDVGLISDTDGNYIGIPGIDLRQGTPDVDGKRVTTVAVRAIDAAGNTSLLGSTDLVYDSGAATPTLALDSDTAGPNGSATDRITSAGTYHAVGVEAGGRAEYSLTGTGGWSATAPLALEGPNTVYVRQVDAAGNTSQAGSLTFTLDTTRPLAPAATLATDSGTAGDGITNSGVVNIGGLETAAGTAWEYRVDGGAWTAGGAIDSQGKSSLAVTDDGAPAVLVRQYDAAGNMSQEGALDFTLDTSVPPALVSTEVTAAGLKVTSQVAGTLVLMPIPGFGFPLDAGGTAITIAAGQTLTVGPQSMSFQSGGTLAVQTAGNDYIADQSGNTYILMTDISDGNVNTDDTNQVIWGFGGNDTLITKGGNDTLYGGAGNDTLNSGAGDDYLDGGEGINIFNPGAGADRIDITQGRNTIVYRTGDSPAGGFDTVTFAATAGSNQAPQTFRFYDMPIVASDRVGGAAGPVDGSAAALFAALGTAYQGKFGTTAGAALVVEFANHDTFLVADTGDGVVNAGDFVIKLVGYVPTTHIASGEVVFGGAA